MIRNGSFGADYELKLLGALVGVMIALYHLIRYRKLDYVWVYLIGFSIWFSVEWFLQSMGIRAIKDAYLFGEPIPAVVQAMLRGGFEGATIATLGIFFADGFLKKGREAWIFMLAFFFLMIGVVFQSLEQAQPFKEIGGDVLSRRDMLNPVGLVLLFGALGLTLLWYFKKADKRARSRAKYLYFVMVSVGVIWNIAEVMAHTRWIETGTFEAPVRAQPMVEILALGWDSGIEIAMAYMPFLVIPYVLKLIK